MSATFRATTLSLILTVLVGGPLAPFARAQQPETPATQAPAPPAPAAPAPAAPAPAVPAPAVATPPAPAPELFQESIKANPSDMTDSATPDRYSPAYDAGAALADVFYIPGKAVLCAIGFSVGITVLVITVGSGYRAASAVGREGCGGKWVLTGNDLRPGAPSSSYAPDDPRR
jgi:hypothetical protein